MGRYGFNCHMDHLLLQSSDTHGAKWVYSSVDRLGVERLEKRVSFKLAGHELLRAADDWPREPAQNDSDSRLLWPLPYSSELLSLSRLSSFSSERCSRSNDGGVEPEKVTRRWSLRCPLRAAAARCLAGKTKNDSMWYLVGTSVNLVRNLRNKTFLE